MLTPVNPPCRMWTRKGGAAILNTTDVARELGISRQRVHRLLVEGKLYGERVGKRGWIITEAALDRYKREKDATPPGSTRAGSEGSD